MSRTLSHPSSGRHVAGEVRRRVEAGGERLWRVEDFGDLSFPAVAQALSRLTRAQALRRLSKGVYYRSRKTTFGESRPNPTSLQALATKQTAMFPAGLAAANLLGFSTQSPSRKEFSTNATSLPRKLVGSNTVVHTRRPATWAHLSQEDGALLEFLRDGGKTTELSGEDTAKRALTLLGEDGRFHRLAEIAPSEPPRVRAMLGVLGQELEAPKTLLASLRSSLNPLSKFDFGVFATLPGAAAWQAKQRG